MSSPVVQLHGRHGVSLQRAVALAVVLALAAGACSSDSTNHARDGIEPATTTAPSPAPTSTTSTAVEPATSAPPASAPPTVKPPGEEAMLAALESAGIVVIDAEVPVSSAAVMTLTAAQADVMAGEVEALAGIRGADLDAAAGGAPTPLPMSAFLGAYVDRVQTPAAAYVRSIMRGQDLTHPADAVFPSVVLALFAADAASAFSAEPSGFAPAAFVHPALLTATCTGVTKAIFDGVDEIFAKLHVPQGKVGDTGSSFLNGLLQGLTDIVVAGLNFVITAAKTLIVEGIEYVLDKVLGFVATVAAAAALVAEFVTAVRPWTVNTTADSEQIATGIDPSPAPVTATATLTVLGPTDDWPDWFTDCAQAAKVTLPSLLPVGAAVEWKVETLLPDTDLLTESTAVVKKDATMRKEGPLVLAKVGLATGTETREQYDTGEAREGAVIVTATVSRKEVRELRETLIQLVNSLATQVLLPVPGFIRDYLLKLVNEAASAATGQIAALLDVSSATAIGVTYHGAPRPRPTTIPPASSSPPHGGYCALYIDFSNWSLANLEAITTEAGTSSWTVRDAFFTEYLVRITEMQGVEPPQLHDALTMFAGNATLYLAHDLAGAAANVGALAAAATSINDYGKSVCGYDPFVT